MNTAATAAEGAGTAEADKGEVGARVRCKLLSLSFTEYYCCHTRHWKAVQHTAWWRKHTAG